MGIWLVRGGAHGQYEQKFIQENRVYLTWDNFAHDLSKISDREGLLSTLEKTYPDAGRKTLINWASQIGAFKEIKKSDLVVMPLKSQPSIYIGEVVGDYHFEKAGPSPYFHWLPVKWIGESVPRANFGQDLLYSFGAFLTICRIKRNSAEARIASMRANGWNPEALVPAKAPRTATAAAAPISSSEATDETGSSDLEELAHDQIAAAINARFKGHNLTRLVEAILQAQGYTTYRSPEGADGGSDILAGAGPLGFGSPKLCVEVKSESSPIDRPTVDKLLGAVSKFGAQEGLFVAWGGFKGNVQKELASSFFKVRLWTQKELLEQLFANYDKLDETIRAELPLKRIWMVAAADKE